VKNITQAPDLFLDTSALFAGIWSESGASRQLLKLGELGLITIVLSAQVLSEIDYALRLKAPQTMGMLAVLLDRAQVRITPTSLPRLFQQARMVVSHPGDARVIADAWDAKVDFFVTLDRQHLLSNEPLIQMLPFPVGTPGDALAWYRERFLSP